MNLIPAHDQLDIRREGNRVLLLKGGALLADMPWEAALEVARALQALGKQAEQIAKIEKVIDDQAILLRSGVALGLTNNPAAQHEALRKAEFDPALRKHYPNKLGGIPSDAVIGIPTISTK